MWGQLTTDTRAGPQHSRNVARPGGGALPDRTQWWEGRPFPGWGGEADWETEAGVRLFISPTHSPAFWEGTLTDNRCSLQGGLWGSWQESF